MNKIRNIFFSLLVVIVMPVASYCIFVYYGNKTIVLPRKFFYDTIITQNINGKIKDDTIWHSIKNFKFLNQLNDTISWESLNNQLIVLNFMFTRCPSFCPTLTLNMKKLHDAFYKKKINVQFISITVDPEFDRPEVLKKYADNYSANHYRWWFLTGQEKDIYQMAYNEFHVATENKGTMDFLHTDKFILIDKKHIIRGFYSGQDSLEMRKIADHLVLLSLEKH